MSELLDKILATRSAEHWTSDRRAALRALAIRYANGDESQQLVEDVVSLVPSRSTMDPDSSASLFSTWLLNRAGAMVRSVDLVRKSKAVP